MQSLVEFCCRGRYTKYFFGEIIKNLSVKFEKTYNLNFFFIKIGSEAAEISLNITISNICVPPQIFDDLKKPLKKRNSAFYVVFQPMPMLDFLCGFFMLIIVHTTSRPCIVIIN